MRKSDRKLLKKIFRMVHYLVNEHLDEVELKLDVIEMMQEKNAETYAAISKRLDALERDEDSS